jgi:hypothetical protein
MTAKIHTAPNILTEEYHSSFFLFVAMDDSGVSSLIKSTSTSDRFLLPMRYKLFFFLEKKG